MADRSSPLLNQTFIEARRPEITTNLIRRDPTSAPPPRFDDPRSVARYILAHVAQGTVHPTEGYFYYRFPLVSDAGELETVSGNLRFTSIDNGVLHLGYFIDGDLSRTNAASLSADDGVRIRSRTVGESPKIREHTITLDGVTSTFRVSWEYRDRQPSLQLLPSERFVTGVLDESAHPLVLVFDETDEDSPAFRYIVNLAYPPTEVLLPIAHDLPDVFVGVESGFVFLRSRSPDRMTLIAVSAQGVRANSYFDGPFDQVPPDLDLRPLLHKAYPYTVEVSPVDQHGNFVGRDSSRVAISPYVTYESLDELAAAIRSAPVGATIAEPLALARLLTREYQQSFMPPRRRDQSRPGIPVGDTPITLGDIIRMNRGEAPLPGKHTPKE